MEQSVGYNDFPEADWIKIEHWVHHASGPQKVYFLAIVPRDMGLLKSEIQALNKKDMDLWTLPYPFRDQTFELFRRYARPSYTAGEIIYIKREISRLGIYIPSAEFMYCRVVEDGVESYEFQAARNDYLEALIDKKQRYKAVKQTIRIGDALCPTDKKYLDETPSWEFPVNSWATISKWATKVPSSDRGVIVKFMIKIASLFPALISDKRSLERLKQYNWRVHARAFMPDKQAKEYIRRLRSRCGTMEVHVMQLLLSECDRRDIDVPFLKFLDKHYANSPSDTKINIREWSKAFVKESNEHVSTEAMKNVIPPDIEDILLKNKNIGIIEEEIEMEHRIWYFTQERKYQGKNFEDMLRVWEQEQKEFVSLAVWTVIPNFSI